MKARGGSRLALSSQGNVANVDSRLFGRAGRCARSSTRQPAREKKEEKNLLQPHSWDARLVGPSACGRWAYQRPPESLDPPHHLCPVRRR